MLWSSEIAFNRGTIDDLQKSREIGGNILNAVDFPNLGHIISATVISNKR